MVKTVIKLEIAVKDIESAMSPFETCVIKLLVGPPGHAAIIMRPTAITGDKLKTTANANPTRGNNISWLVRPTNAAFGYLNTRLKSSITNDNPIPNIITANETGSTTDVNIESSIL